MEHVQKQHFSFNSRKGSSPSEVFFKNITAVFWANVMNEQWQINNLISWKFLLKNPYVNPKKQFAYNTNWILDPLTQVQSAEHMAKNQFQMHILWFFFHADVKM